MSGMEVSESSSDTPCRSFRENPPPINPVIPAAGGADKVSVSKIDYVARWARYDTEECIRRALEDGEIELFHRNQCGDRSYDMYRLTAKGRNAADEHIRGVIERSREATRRAVEQKSAQAEPSAAALNGGLSMCSPSLKRAAPSPAGAGGRRSLSGTGVSESSSDTPCRSFRENPPPINPVIPAAGGADTVSVSKIDYVARWARYDTEECIRRALEDGEIELFHRNQCGDRSYDMYRLTAKGRNAADEHIRGVIERSREATRRAVEQKSAQAEPSSAAEPEPRRPERRALDVPAC